MRKAAFFLLGTVLLWQGMVFACSCVPQTEEEYFRQADVVVKAKVLSIEEFPDDYRWQVKMEVIEVLKGEVAETFDMDTASQGSMCGVSFKEGESYLVYAGIIWFESYPRQPSYATDLCSGTRLLEE